MDEVIYIDARWIVLAVAVIATVWFIRRSKNDWATPLTCAIAVAVALFAMLRL